ncbi:LysR family transcriptional regulator [Chitinibacter fontanus]|uniref:LysR family transcriptional regulator n=1 Tax=Chitinibacter fontanus TaxID=1737446 RepID=A0A7D5VBR2_9NEIS|nr:LysR family transcriptional regulator [Chitinibacter fontanus]QLI82520.1 LysR family transcriptional regulator [Chitinibacter fontanus]
MHAKTQYHLGGQDLEFLLAVSRGGTLAAAAERLGVDASTVFRSIQRIEKGLGQRLFERSKAGYLPTELAQTLAQHAEQMEIALESARSAAQLQPEDVAGSVRITTTDSILHGLVAPELDALARLHPQLSFDLHTGNELANLTRRDADIAIRATRKPPQHLVGKHLGSISVALFAAPHSPWADLAAAIAQQAPWIAPDDALPDHPTVLWRKKHYPKITPRYRVNSILTVVELIERGMGVGMVPLFLAATRPNLRPLTGALVECATDLWLLTHPESRHLRRVATVFSHLAQHIQLR